MTGLLLYVIDRSMAAGWLILAVLAARLVLRRSPKWINVLLWGIVAVRLLCPFSIESRLSLIPQTTANITDIADSVDIGNKVDIASRADTVASKLLRGLQSAAGMDEDAQLGKTAHQPKGTKDTANAGMTENSKDVGNVRKNQTGNASPRQSFFGTYITDAAGKGNALGIGLAIVWLAGVLILVLFSALRYWRLHRQVATAVRLRDNIFQSEHVRSPFVLGIKKPKIYLPFAIDRRDLEYVIAHEQAHIRCGDPYWKLLASLLASVYWFHPLIWLAYALLCRDLELACDERVIRSMNPEQRADYSQALLTCSMPCKNSVACPLAFGEVGVKERVKSVLSYKKPAVWGIAAAVALCIAIAICFLTDPARSNAAEYISEGDSLAKRPKADATGNGTAGLDTTEVELPETAGNTILGGQDISAGQNPSAGQNSSAGQNMPTEQESPSGQNTPVEWNGTEGAEGRELEELPAGQQEKFSDRIVWEEADLDRDGEAEQIWIHELEPGELYELEVVKKDGSVLWNMEAGLPHTGWNTIFLYQDPIDGLDYLVQYQPTMYQGIGSYFCTMYSLKGGNEAIEKEWSMEFTLPLQQLTWKMRGFAARVNDMLKNGTILLSTGSDGLVVGPKPGTEVPQAYPVRFDPMEGDSTKYNSTGYSYSTEGGFLESPSGEQGNDTGVEGKAFPKGNNPQEKIWQEGVPQDSLPFEEPSLKFWFASGAGGWRTELTLYPDGRFEGDYEDSEASTGPDYPNGSVFICKFHGQFDQIEALSPNMYRMKLKELVYETEVDDVWIEDGVRYIGSEAYGLVEGTEQSSAELSSEEQSSVERSSEVFIFYLPDTLPQELDEAFLSWWPDRYLWESGSVQTLLSYGIWNVATGDGFFSSWIDWDE